MTKEIDDAIEILDAMAGDMGEFHLCVFRHYPGGPATPYFYMCTENNSGELLAKVAKKFGAPPLDHIDKGCYDKKALHYQLPLGLLKNVSIPVRRYEWISESRKALCMYYTDTPRFDTVEELIQSTGMEPWWWAEDEYKELWAEGKWCI